MTPHEDMGTAQDEQATMGAGAAIPGRRFGRPARMAAATAAVLAAGALVVGCGGKDDSAGAAPESVSGDAAPVGSSHSGDKSEKAGKSGGEDGTGDSGVTGSTGDDAKSTAHTGTKGGTETKSARAAAGANAAGQGSSGSNACTTTDLSAKIGPNHPGAGQENFALVLTNNSGKSCTVRGFPGFAFLNGDGEQVSLNPERTGESGKSLKLAPGKSAWASLSFTNPQMTGVPTVTPDTALLTPPDQRDPLRVDWKGGPVTATGKASVPKIGALTPGTGA